MANNNKGQSIPIRDVSVARTPVKSTKSKMNLVDAFENFLRWVDTNVIPLVAIPLLAIGFADAVKNHLQHLSKTQSLLVGIAAAAFLAAKSPHKQ